MDPSNVMLTVSGATWTPSVPGLTYSVTVCRVGEIGCSNSSTCTGCSSVSIPGIVEDVQYNITVCSSTMANGVTCVRTCTSFTIGK